jgi:hypothetical protein
MQTYGHYEFEDLLKDEENLSCFDCGKSPAQWASVNNAVYLCLNCAGEHRGYGVGVSYVRSITIDTWNDNQINMMKFGGNRNLRELLDVYQIDRKKVDKTMLYNSRLLDFYRKHLKSKVNFQPFEKEPPGKEEALKGLGVDNYSGNVISDSNKYASVSKSGTKTKEEKIKSVTSSDDKEHQEVDSGFVGGLNNWMSKAINSTKFIAGKVGEMELGSKIMTTGNVVAETGSNIVTRGTEAAVRK